MSDSSHHETSSIPDGQLGGHLAGLSLPRQIWKISFWPFIEQVLAFLVSATGLLIAGRLGDSSHESTLIMSGMAASSYIAWLGFIMQGGTAMGATALISRLTGARKYAEANYAATQTFLLGILAGVLSCLLMQVTLDFLLINLLEVSEGAASYARQYMRIMAFSALFSGMVFAMNGALRGSGDTRTPFFIMAGINVVTIGVSCLLVWGPGWIGGHGVKGIAAAPVIGFFVGFLALVWRLLRNRKNIFQGKSRESLDIVLREKGADYVPPLYLDTHKMRFDWEMIWRIVRVGGTQALEVGLVWIVQFYSLRIINKIDESLIGAHMIVIRTESMSFLPGFAIGTASAALVGQYLGARNAKMARKVVLKCMKYAVLFMGCFGVLFFLFPGTFVGFFATKSPELAASSAPALQVAGVAEILFAMSIVLKMSLRGAGDVKRVMLLSLASIAFWRVGVLTMWAHYWPETLTLVRVWILFSLDLAMQTAIFWKIFRGNKWTRYEV